MNCEGSGALSLFQPKIANGTKVVCGHCGAVVPLVNQSDPYRPTRVANHQAEGRE